ncbi:potassium channel subfamily T member 2-like isoform X6 [Octopus sinensis]|uniref:Potassium channel subfamily T member 2-like isoform X6 n=1 Tax=Octopus sinensis TaxID=2607531 RepID=A0A7E6ER19_9MOLL|nr:potassium channel subfamily T member 2-like isoform X6 [Octopus sinensis]
MVSQADFQVPPLPPRYRFRDLIWGESGHQDETRVRVEFFTNEKSFKERLQLYFIKNQRSSLRIRIFNLVIKVLTCVLYVVRVITNGQSSYGQCSTESDVGWSSNSSDIDSLTIGPSICRKETDSNESTSIKWEDIFWVNRSQGLWICQLTVATISLTETVLVQYLSYKGNILQQILSVEFILELINTVPFLITIFSVQLRNLFIPVFFNCWLAKSALQNMFNDLHRVMQKSQSALGQQLMILCATFFCLVFTSACGIQHLQRGGVKQLDLFQAFWFVIVTFSTVGYGDISPDIWPSQLFVIIMICTTLIVLPRQFEQLAYTWIERQKQGGTYSSHRAQTEKHVVVCTTTLQADTVLDFLNEFYAHPKLQDYFVVLLSPCELDPTMKMLLQVPLWAQRVIYIQGSALKDSDLARCRMQDAEACMILAARNYADKNAADQHTILRSWAVKDFAPLCPLYVQIFRPENKFHVKFAEHIVCEDEFKYALLANNCLCPGTSTFVTLLLHTSRGLEGQTSNADWHRLYGRGSGNEIYHIKLGDSKFFGEYEGKSFTFASFHAHRKYGVSLVGIQQDIHNSTIQLNPGPRHIMRSSDICFYMNITKEENSAFILAHPNQEDPKGDKARLPQGAEQASRVASMIASVGTVALELQHTKVNSPRSCLNRQDSKRSPLDLPKELNIQSLQKRPSIAPVPAVLDSINIHLRMGDSDTDSEETDYSESEQTDGNWSNSIHLDYIRGFPPVTPYIGTSPTLCHLLREKRPLCCLQLATTCEHCSYINAKDYNWPNRAIIIAADNASNGLYNFIVPLRSHARPKHTLNPIVLLLEKKIYYREISGSFVYQLPDTNFLETICYFPLVYWMLGSIECLDDLLRAGITLADNVVIVNKESSNSAEEDTLSDCNTIVAVQTIFKLFPSANIITELSQSSNMRFMQFRAKDSYSFQVSKIEKKEKEKGSHMYYMFRLPFAAGNVFSASMLDTLLYQAFVKDYLITFVRLLLGIDQAVGSGHLSCMKIAKDDLWIRTYGRLYQKLCSTTCEIPIGIYRTQQLDGSDTNSSGTFTIIKDQSAMNLAFKQSVVSLSMNHETEEQSTYHTNTTPERQEIAQMVRCRMAHLNLPLKDYNDCGEKKNCLSYVITNPSYDTKLVLDDIIYLIRPSSLSPHPSPLVDERKLLKKNQIVKDSKLHSLSERGEPTGADNSDTDENSDNKLGPFPHFRRTRISTILEDNKYFPTFESPRFTNTSSDGLISVWNKVMNCLQCSQSERIPVEYTHSDEDEDTANIEDSKDTEDDISESDAEEETSCSREGYKGIRGTVV